MFDIAWSEMAVIAVVALVILGPKELPNALRLLASWLRYARKMANEFQSGFNDIVREAELQDMHQKMKSISKGDIGKIIEEHIDPTGDIKKQIASPESDDKSNVKPS